VIRTVVDHYFEIHDRKSGEIAFFGGLHNALLNRGNKIPGNRAAEHLIRQRMTALGRVLPAAKKGDVTSLHQARVASRRLREALAFAMVDLLSGLDFS
jgi:hypothetical protein